MAYSFKLPDIGEGVAEGEIVKWHVQVGDHINEDDVLLEVMTDKVTAEIPAPCSGTITELPFKEGETVPVGKVIAVFQVDGEDAAPAKETVTAAAASGQGKTKTAAMEGNGSSKTVSAPRSTATMPMPTPHRVLAAPATRKLARSMGVDLAVVNGSGPNGRVTPEDVKRAAAGGSVSGIATSKSAACQTVKGQRTPSKPRHGAGEMNEERIPLAGMRKRIAEHLVHAKQTAPHFGYVEEVDMTEVVALRKRLKPQAESDGVSLTFLPFIIKAVIAGLKQYPMLNASLDDAAQEIVYKHYYNMGVAVAANDGLTVPVLHHADEYSVRDMAAAIMDLSERARVGKLTMEDRQHGTFTVTSIGSIGGLFGLPIINHPEVAILGVNKIEDRPVVRDGEIVIRKMMHLSLSGDHRVVDGIDAAQFMNVVKARLEDPASLLYDG